MEYGVTKDGFKLKTFLNIIEEIEEQYKIKLRSDYKIDMYSPEGIHTEAIANELRKIWENLLELSNNSFIETATGIWLDKFGELLGEKRKKGRIASGLVRVMGKENTTLPLNSELKIGDNLIYLTNETATLTKTENGVEYYQDIYITAENVGDIYNNGVGVKLTYGETDLKIFSITEIKGGEFGEIDTEYRKRLLQKKESKNVATHKALKNAILQLENINDVLILAPDTEPSTDIGTIKIFVDGTPNDKIFEVIANTKSAGILTVADNQAKTKEKKIDVDGVLVDVKYTQIEFIIPKIIVKVLSVSDGQKNLKWTNPIIEKVTNYINNLKIGESIDYLELYSEIRGIYEVRNIQLLISINEEEPRMFPLENTIFNIENYKKFTITKENIRVEYVE